MSDGPTGDEFDNRRHLGHRSWQEQCMMGEGDEDKTREQLVDEVRAFRAETAALRGRVACLEAVQQFLARLLEYTPAPALRYRPRWPPSPGQLGLGGVVGAAPRGSRRPHGG